MWGYVGWLGTQEGWTWTGSHRRVTGLVSFLFPRTSRPFSTGRKLWQKAFLQPTWCSLPQLDKDVGGHGAALSFYQSPCPGWEREKHVSPFFILNQFQPFYLPFFFFFLNACSVFLLKYPLRKNLDIPLLKYIWLATAWELIWLGKLGQGRQALEG